MFYWQGIVKTKEYMPEGHESNLTYVYNNNNNNNNTLFPKKNTRVYMECIWLQTTIYRAVY